MNNMKFPSQQIGEFSITAVSDGYLSASLDLLSNIDPTDASKLQQDAGVNDPSSIHINCYLVRGRGRTILIDAGAGGFKQWGGKLKAHLALAGVQPSEIDTILLTHAHPDHVGGLVDASGEISFPDAELVVPQREVSFWEDDGNLSRASERARGNFLFARKVFDKYREKMRTFTDNEVLPGISAMPLLGHTAGHSGQLHSTKIRFFLLLIASNLTIVVCWFGGILFIFLKSRLLVPTYQLHSTKIRFFLLPHDRSFWMSSVRTTS